jgi:hypothetical protein
VPRSYFSSAKTASLALQDYVHLRASANLRIDLDQLLVSDGSKLRRLFPYVRQLAAVEMGRLLLISKGHAPRFVR